MADRAPLRLGNRNPDVLTCIANLSNDEVFTPPEFANRMLDLLAEAWADAHDGADLWADPKVTFLDPFTKSGVFLREITTRLTEGLRGEIPDLQERVDHILTRQVYGIGITRLTSLIARRSVYCSKWADGPHSIARSFGSPDGNIWFEPMEHTWVGGSDRVVTTDEHGHLVERPTNGKCRYCGASQRTLDRGPGSESHAYAFIHTDDIRARLAELFGADMQFDVIIGNPPYQLQSDGGTRDMPIYQKFVEQAKTLKPRFLTMVIPSRWMASGLGLTEFRQTMLADRRLRSITDYPMAKEVFPSVEVKAGVCFFLWDLDYSGDCAVTTVRGKVADGPHPRDLREFDVLVRDSRALQVLRKVQAVGEPSIVSILSVDKEFGWTSNFDGYHAAEQPGDVPIHHIRGGKRGIGYISRPMVGKSSHLIDTWKVLVPQAYGAGESIPHQILGRPYIASSPSVCTQSYLFFWIDDETSAESLESYLRTRFLRFLVSLRKITQHATRSTYTWVPMQTWDRTWSDEELYAKYAITDAEVAYIESMVRPMESSS